MKRRQFLKAGGSAAVGAAAAGTLAAPAIAQGTLQWKMVTAWPKNLPGPGVAAQLLADRITALSGGRIEVRLYAAGELVPGPGVFDAVSEGTAEL
ncbi:MAG: ABC transporter substrate-binding protein, partial [Kiloniellaceae bacterium]